MDQILNLEIILRWSLRVNKEQNIEVKEMTDLRWKKALETKLESILDHEPLNLVDMLDKFIVMKHV